MHLFSKLLNSQIAAVTVQLVLSLLQVFQNLSTLFQDTQVKITLLAMTTLLPITMTNGDKMCILTNCRDNMIAIGDTSKFLQEVISFYFIYQQVHIFYTHLKYQFIDRIVVQIRQVTEGDQRASYLNQQKKE